MGRRTELRALFLLNHLGDDEGKVERKEKGRRGESVPVRMTVGLP